MSSEEKDAHPKCEVTGGCLRKYKYKKAFRRSFESAMKKDNWQKELALLKALSNFDVKVFEKISGIHPEELV